jgi:hypothetical protein
MVPEIELAAVVIRITQRGNIAMNDDGGVGELRSIKAEKRTKCVSS